MPTEQQSLDALLPVAKEHEPGLAEVLTHTIVLGPYGEQRTVAKTRPLDSAHVAAEYWLKDKGWQFGWDRHQFYVIPPDRPYFYFEGENAIRGADIFAAIKAALEEE